VAHQVFVTYLDCAVNYRPIIATGFHP
jgi:hypothetical protein